MRYTKWERQFDGTWKSGALLIQRSRKTKRYYLMETKWIGDPLVISDYASLKEAKDAGEDLAKRWASHK